MIIKYPTALYGSALPQSTTSGGNVTYTVSMTVPPRSTVYATRIPPSHERRRKLPRKYNEAERRSHVGERVYTTTKAGNSTVGSAKKQYECGQILEFTDQKPVAAKPMLIASSIQIRHDTNVLDLSGLGIGDDVAATLAAVADQQFKELQDQLNTYRQQRADAETAIAENKKSQNEAVKAIAAVAELAKLDGTMQPVLDGLQAKLDKLRADYDRLITAANLAADKASEIVEQSRKIAQLVR